VRCGCWLRFECGSLSPGRMQTVVRPSYINEMHHEVDGPGSHIKHLKLIPLAVTVTVQL